MYMTCPMSSGEVLSIIVRGETERRLASRCFRPHPEPKAGRFSNWRKIEHLFQNERVKRKFVDEIERCWRDEEISERSSTFSAQVQCDEHIGWSSTAPRHNFHVDELEPFAINDRARGLRVRAACANRRAPRTDTITFVYELKIESGSPVAVIHSVYPGKDIGDLKGDVSQRESVVFYDWDHTGE